MDVKTFASRTACLLLLSGLAFFQTGRAATITSAASGLWNDTNTWLGGSVPTSGDDVVINHTVTLNTSAPTVASLAISGGGQLVGPFDIDVAGLLTINNGTFNNTGNATAGSLLVDQLGSGIIGAVGATGTLTVSGAATIGNGSLIGKTLVLQGATTKQNGTFNVQNGATLRVAPGGTMTLDNTTNGATDFAAPYATPGTIDNQGTITKASSTTLFFLSETFTNSGTLQVDGGILQIWDRGGSFTAGTVAIGMGCAVNLAGFNGPSAYTFSGGTVSGGGKLGIGYLATATFTGATLSTEVDFTHALGGGTLVDNTAGGLTPLNVILPSGTWQGTAGPAISGDLQLTGGTFNPSANATVGGDLLWSKGDIGTASATSSNITVSGSVDFTTANSKAFYKKNLICQSGATSSAIAVDFFSCTLTIPGGQTLTCNTTANSVKFGSTQTPTSGTLALSGTLDKQGSDILYLKGLNIQNNGQMLLNSGITQFTGDQDIFYSGTGSIAVGAGATFHRFNGTNAVLNYGNATFTNNGTVSNFDLKFSGSSAQTLDGDGAVYGIVVQNAAGLTISGAQSVAHDITFTNGKITLQDGDLTLSSTSEVFGASTSKFIVTPGQGRLVWEINALTTFPVGTNAPSYNPITISPSAQSTFGVRVQVGFDADKPTGTNELVNRQWQVDRVSGSATASLTFQWNTPEDLYAGGGFNSASCHVSRWDGSQWEASANAAASCASGVCTRTRTGVSNFSPFGVASGLALPIELASFRGEEAGPVDHFEWETASESNTKTFHLQRSPDGINGWGNIADRAAAGSSTAHHFYTADDPVPPREAYYRLLVEDLDGRSEASPVVFVKRKSAGGGQFSAFPNPADGGGFWLDVPQGLGAGTALSVELFDAAGRSVFSKNMEVAADGEPLLINMTEPLSAGAYFLKIGSAASVQTLPVVVR